MWAVWPASCQAARRRLNLIELAGWFSFRVAVVDATLFTRGDWKIMYPRQARISAVMCGPPMSGCAVLRLRLGTLSTPGACLANQERGENRCDRVDGDRRLFSRRTWWL